MRRIPLGTKGFQVDKWCQNREVRRQQQHRILLPCGHLLCKVLEEGVDASVVVIRARKHGIERSPILSAASNPNSKPLETLLPTS